MSRLPPEAAVERTTVRANRVTTAPNRTQQFARLFDHLVGALLKKPRHVDPQCLRGFHIQNELEPRR
jgi:hypothetical protein